MPTDEREQLLAEIERLRAVVDRQAAVIDAQAALIEELRSRLEEVQSRLNQDSSNSSLAPSRDRKGRRTRRAEERAARRAANEAEGKPTRPTGKQKGAPGSTLCRRAPDRRVVHAPTCCERCGADLVDAPVVSRATRQVLEIPAPHLEAIDHVVERRCCKCGHETRATFPPEATAPVCWGPRARAVAIYLLARQHVPLERGAEAMKVLFDAPMGEGTMAGVLTEAAAALAGFEARVRDLLVACPVAHADETSVKVGVGLGWVHTVSTSGLTFLSLHEKRGIDAIIDIGLLTGYTGTIVHDGLATYDQPELAGAIHAQCHAHLARTLNKIAEHSSQTPWARAMKTLLADAKAASEQAAAAGLAVVPDAIAGPISDRFDEILEQAFIRFPPLPPPWRRHRGGWTNAEREAWNLATRMRRQRDQVLRLLEDTRVPADNNEAERSVRMCKLHDKISGTFRSDAHAKAFLMIRSYLQTGAKHGQKALDLLTRLWRPDGAWLPSVTVPDTS